MELSEQINNLIGKLDQKKLESFLKSHKAKIDNPENVISAIKSEDLGKKIESLSEEDKKSIQHAMTDKKALMELLNNPETQKKIRDFLSK